MISPAFNAVILAMVPAFEAKSFAPSTFADLMQGAAMRPLVVWDGASDQTIYGDARVNHAFRAWHDATHIASQYDFTLAGEHATCADQCAQLLRHYPQAPRLWLDVIRAEVIGQAEHFARTGAFPVDQTTFIRSILNVG